MSTSRAMAVLLCVSGVPASAGPWAREDGGTFLSFSWEADADLALAIAAPAPLDEVNHALSVFAERGLGNRLTGGIDAFLPLGGSGFSGLAFLRRNLTPGDAVQQWALTGGLGLAGDGQDLEPLAMGGLSWGRGLDTRWGSGWASLDGQLRYSGSGPAAKLDGTLGLTPRERISLIGQVQVSRYPDAETEARVGLGMVRRMTDRLSLEATVLHGVLNDDRTGVKLGTWLEF